MPYFRAYVTNESVIITPIHPAHITVTEAIFEDGTSIPLKCRNGCVAKTFKEAQQYAMKVLRLRIDTVKDDYTESVQKLDNMISEVRRMHE